MDAVLNSMEDFMQYIKGFLGLYVEGLRDVSSDCMGVVVEVVLFGLEIYVWIVYDMVLFHEFLWIVD